LPWARESIDIVQRRASLEVTYLQRELLQIVLEDEMLDVRLFTTFIIFALNHGNLLGTGSG